MASTTKYYGADDIFSSSSPWALTAYMNLHKVTVADLKVGRINSKREFSYGLVIAYLKEKAGYRAEAGVEVMRNFRRRYGHYSTDYLAFNHALRMAGVDSGRLQGFIDSLIAGNGLYDTPEGVKAELAGTFSYDTYEQYEYELEQHRDVECSNPECGSTNTIYCEGSDDIENISNWFSGDFEHVTGPYCRCKACGTVMRPVVSEAREVKTEYDTGEEWDEYKEDLQELVHELGEHISKHGLPKPAKLAITARNVDWRHRTGTAMTAFEGAELADAMRVDGDFTISNGKLWLYENGTGELTCTMSHHDVPTGGGITVVPVWDCELGEGTRYDEEYCYGDALAAHQLLAEVATIILPGHPGPNGEFSAGSTFKLVSVQGLVEALEWIGLEFEKKLPEAATRDEALSFMIGERVDDLVQAVKGIDSIVSDTILSARLKVGTKVLRDLIEAHYADRPSDTSDAGE